MLLHRRWRWCSSTQVVGNLRPFRRRELQRYAQPISRQEKVKYLHRHRRSRLVAKLQDGSSVSCALHSFDTFYNDMNDLVVSQAEKGIITSYDYAAGNENGWLRTLLPYVLAAMALHPADEPDRPYGRPGRRRRQR